MKSKSKKYTESQLRRWEICYHEAGHAVITAYYDAEHHDGDFSNVNKEIVVFKEPKDCTGNGHRAGGYHCANFWVRFNMSLQDNLDVCLAGFYAETLNPYKQRRGLSAGQDDDPKGDIQSAERLCGQISRDPQVALIESKARLEKLIERPEVAEAIHDLAKVCYVLSQENEVIAGDVVDKIIINAVYNATEWDVRGTRERVDCIQSLIGDEECELLFADLLDKLANQQEELGARAAAELTHTA